MGLILDLAAKQNCLGSRLPAPVLQLRLITWEHFTSLVSGDWKTPEMIRVAINNRIGLSVVNCFYRLLDSKSYLSCEAAEVTVRFVSSMWPLSTTAGTWM